MADLMFVLGQTKKKKESEAKVKFSKARLQNVTITETVESIVRSNQRNRDRKYNETKRQTKKNLKYVTQGETGEMAVRKQQADRDKRWKQTGRNQFKKNSKFDMARSLFGGGCQVPSALSTTFDEKQIRKEEDAYEESVTEEYNGDTITDYYGDTITDYYGDTITEYYYEEEISDYDEEYVEEEFIIVIDEDCEI